MLKISNEQLVLFLKKTVEAETRLTTEVLEHLREVEARELFLKMGYSSLFEFCMKELKYSESSALRRISAMRLVKEMPQIKEQILSGDLSLSNIYQAQTFFKNQERKKTPYSFEKKIDLLKSLENCSARDCERELLKLDPQLIYRDRERAVTAELTEIRLTVDIKFMHKLEAVKNRISHAKPYASTKDTLEFALEEILARRRWSQFSPPTLKVKKLADQVWEKSQGQCCYVDPKSGRRCDAKRFLEIDHIQPRTRSGSNDLSNLQLLCSAHNKLKSNHVQSASSEY